MPMSFNPDTGLVYIPAQELYMPFKKDENYNYDKKGWNEGKTNQLLWVDCCRIIFHHLLAL